MNFKFHQVVGDSLSQHHPECKRRGRNCLTEKLNGRCVGRANVRIILSIQEERFVRGEQ
jgi:hypothetical protein